MKQKESFSSIYFENQNLFSTFVSNLFSKTYSTDQTVKKECCRKAL